MKLPRNISLARLRERWREAPERVWPPLPGLHAIADGARTVRSRITPLATALLACTLLAACGKKGPPEAPGPPSEITWPRIYPTR